MPEIEATNVVASWLPERRTNWNADSSCQKNGENSGPLTSLPVHNRNGDWLQ